MILQQRRPQQQQQQQQQRGNFINKEQQQPQRLQQPQQLYGNFNGIDVQHHFRLQQQQQQQQQQHTPDNFNKNINKRQEPDDNGGLWGKRGNILFENEQTKRANRFPTNIERQTQPNNEEEILVRKLLKLRSDVDEILAGHFNVLKVEPPTSKRQVIESAGLWG